MKRKNVSKPQSLIRDTLEKLYPGFTVSEEVHLGNKLRLDLLVREIGLGVEFHGRQHFELVKHFHLDNAGYQRAKQRDKNKQIRCIELNIQVIEFDYREKLTPEYIIEKILGEFKQNKNYNPSDINSLECYKNKVKLDYQLIKEKKKENVKDYKMRNRERLLKQRQDRLQKASRYRKEQYLRAKKLKDTLKEKSK